MAAQARFVKLLDKSDEVQSGGVGPIAPGVQVLGNQTQVPQRSYARAGEGEEAWSDEARQAALAARRAKADPKGEQTYYPRKDDPVRRGARLGVPEQHQLRIAKDTLKMSGPMAGVMGGMNHAQARQIVHGAPFAGKTYDQAKNHPDNWSDVPMGDPSAVVKRGDEIRAHFSVKSKQAETEGGPGSGPRPGQSHPHAGPLGNTAVPGKTHPTGGTHVGNYRGHDVYMAGGGSYNVPSIKEWGHGNDLSATRAINRHIAKQAKNAAARARHQAYTDLGMKKTPYGYETEEVLLDNSGGERGPSRNIAPHPMSLEAEIYSEAVEVNRLLEVGWTDEARAAAAIARQHGYQKSGSSRDLRHERGHTLHIADNGEWAHMQSKGGQDAKQSWGHGAHALSGRLADLHGPGTYTGQPDRPEGSPGSDVALKQGHYKMGPKRVSGRSTYHDTWPSDIGTSEEAASTTPNAALTRKGVRARLADGADDVPMASFKDDLERKLALRSVMGKPDDEEKPKAEEGLFYGDDEPRCFDEYGNDVTDDESYDGQCYDEAGNLLEADPQAWPKDDGDIATDDEAHDAEMYTKDEVNYRYAPQPEVQSCGNCVHFEDGACELVAGLIRPIDLCDLWEQGDEDENDGAVQAVLSEVGWTDEARAAARIARMSKMHFRQFAHTIRHDVPEEQRGTVANHFADSLTSTNPKFDRERFIKASSGKGPFNPKQGDISASTIKTPKMSRVQYEHIADTINSLPEHMRGPVSDSFARALRGTNPNYNEEKFRSRSTTPRDGQARQKVGRQ